MANNLQNSTNSEKSTKSNNSLNIKIDNITYPNINALLKSYQENDIKSKFNIKNSEVKYETEIQDPFIADYEQLLHLREWYSQICGLPDTTVESWSTVNIEHKKKMKIPNFRFCLIYMIKDLTILLEGNRDPGFEDYLFPKGDFNSNNKRRNLNTFKKVVLTDIAKKPRSSTSVARYSSTLKRTNQKINRNNITDFAKQILKDIDEVIENGIYYIPFMEALMKFLFLFTYADKKSLSKYNQFREMNFNSDELTECVGLDIIIKSYDTPYIIYPVSYFVSFRVMNSFMLAPVLPLILSNTVRRTDRFFVSPCGQVNHDIIDHSEFTHGFHSFLDYQTMNMYDNGKSFFKSLFINLNKYCNPDILKEFNYDPKGIPKFIIPANSNQHTIEFSSLNDNQKKYVYAYVYHLIFHEIISFGSCGFDDKIVLTRLHTILTDKSELLYSNIYEVIGNDQNQLINYLRVNLGGIVMDMPFIIQFKMLDQKGISDHENFLTSHLIIKKAVLRFVYFVIPELIKTSNDKLLKKILDLLLYAIVYDYRYRFESFMNQYIEIYLKKFEAILSKFKYINYLDPKNTKRALSSYFQDLLHINISKIEKDPYTSNNYIMSNGGRPCNDEFRYLILWKLIQSTRYPYKNKSDDKLKYGPINKDTIVQPNIKVEIASIDELIEIWEPDVNPTVEELQALHANNEDISIATFPALSGIQNYGIPEYKRVDKRGDKPVFLLEIRANIERRKKERESSQNQCDNQSKSKSQSHCQYQNTSSGRQSTYKPRRYSTRTNKNNTSRTSLRPPLRQSNANLSRNWRKK